MRARFAGNLLLLGWLTLLWVLLWRDLSVANVLGGLLAGAFVLAVLPFRADPRGGRLRPWPAVRLLLRLGWNLVVANAVVAWEVVTPRSRINEGIVAVPIVSTSEALITLLANAITLTPGTLVLDCRPDDDGNTVLYVHVLHLHDVESVRRDVVALETLVIRAFGSPGAVAALQPAHPAEPGQGPGPEDHS
jgi:multicomponent Na+:H+ antiporter subunit E